MYNHREMLGWATEPEFVYDAMFQCNAGRGDVYTRCYLLSPEGEVLVLSRGTLYQWRVYIP
jgi:hypothetical protein